MPSAKILFRVMGKKTVIYKQTQNTDVPEKPKSVLLKAVIL